MGNKDKNPPNNGIKNYPIHDVTLSSFYICKYEVTQEEWETIMDNNPSYSFGANLPIERISWTDAQEFIKRLSLISGITFRLPTEAEWEYAAKGGNKTNGYIYSGSNNIYDVASIDVKIQKVGMKNSNELGIYDMSGNVQEICQDYYDDYSSDPQKDPICTNYDTLSDYQFVVVRGGSCEIEDCKVYQRSEIMREGTSPGVGFRLACTNIDY